MEILTILALINGLLALISITIGILVLFRVAGKLSRIVIFIILSIGMVFIRDILFFFGVDTPIVTSIMRGFCVLFSLLAILCIKKVVQIIDGQFDHKPKKRQ